MPFEGLYKDTLVGDVDRHIGARLQGRRMMLRLSPEVLAVRARVDVDAYREYECGTMRIPAAALFEVCQVLRVPVRFVFHGYESSEGAAKQWAAHPGVPVPAEGD